MLVYGDRVRTTLPATALAAIAARLQQIRGTSPGIVRHGLLAGALIEAGELAQGLADLELEQRGADGPSPLQDAAVSLVMALASALAISWGSGFEQIGSMPRLENLRKLLPAAPVELKTPEGYAFYAVYPESYLEAAEALADPPTVIGLRSIGTSLAAMVAVGAGAERPLTVRPTGHPFAREVKLRSPPDPARSYAIVDEGPGLSGSSFGAVADLLEDAGVPAERIVFFPSHSGDLGPEASERHRTRWASARRLVNSFDEHHLPGWFADLVGEPIAPLEDLSGGQWRRERDIPADPTRERRKYLLRTDIGAFLLKFAGVGRIGEEKFARAQTLHAAGFCPEPLGFRHGFLIERWHQDTGQPDPETVIGQLGRYLAYRAATFPAADDEGANSDELAAMATRNAGIELKPPAASPRVRTDNRLHAWEWLQLPGGRVLKTDAVDHDNAHDLIGCQPIAWDVGGAKVEFNLSAEETAQLCRETDIDPALLGFYVPCYAAFQLGLWTFAQNDEQVARYRRALASN